MTENVRLDTPTLICCSVAKRRLPQDKAMNSRLSKPFGRSLITLLLFLLGTLLWCSRIGAQVAPSPSSASGKTLQSADINDRLMYVLTYQKLSIPVYEVKDQTVFPEQVLYASKIIFHPNSTLLLAGSGGDRNEIYIVAQSIVVDWSGVPPAQREGAIPTIRWFHDDTSDRVSPNVGIAPSGTIGGGAGVPGTPGSDGAIGNPGYPGRNAPTVYLITGGIVGQLRIDLRGQDGGPGGPGQTGGTGGPGQFGRPAISQLVFCSSGGGNGGNGGKGGDGGKGGTGGRGGSGGSFVVASSPNILEGILAANVSDSSAFTSTLLHSASPSNPLAQARPILWLGLDGGRGGPGGQGGAPGQGGTAGDGGSGSGPCGGGHRGLDGPPGHPGPNGVLGPGGPPGTYAVVPLPDTLLNLLGLNQNADRR